MVLHFLQIIRANHWFHWLCCNTVTTQTSGKTYITWKPVLSSHRPLICCYCDKWFNFCLCKLCRLHMFVLVWMFWFSGVNLFLLSVWHPVQGEVTILKGSMWKMDSCKLTAQWQELKYHIFILVTACSGLWGHRVSVCVLVYIRIYLITALQVEPQRNM